jgi:hypothetical protein
MASGANSAGHNEQSNKQTNKLFSYFLFLSLNRRDK